jgi:DNA-binding transcriptional ArsR family regulator
MRPIYHPHRDEITVQGILYALSDPVRVQIFSQLMGSDCSQNCTTFVNVGATPLPKSTLSQHFKILREAGLIRSERKGVELQNRTRCEDLEKFKPMLREILAAYQAECQSARQTTPAVPEPAS